MVDAHFFESRLTAALDGATAHRYSVTVEAAEWEIWGPSLQLKNVTIRPYRRRKGTKFSSSRPSRRVRGSIPALDLRGIDVWALLWRRSLRLDEVRLRRPRGAIQNHDAATRPPPDPADGTEDSTRQQAGLSGVHVDRLRVEEGILTRSSQGSPPRDSLWGLSAQFDSLGSETLAGEAVRKDLASMFSGASFDGYRRALSGTPYVLRLGPGRVLRPDSTLTVEDVRLSPTLSDTTFMRNHEYRVNRFRTRASRVAVLGFEREVFVQDGALAAATVEIDGLDLDVSRDNHLPPDPDDPPPPMPQDAAERLDRDLRIDTVRLRDSRIRYTKRPEEVSRTGAISFENLWATLYDVSTDPERGADSSPMVVEARTRVNGAGQLRTTLRIPLQAPDLALSFEGRLGAMDPRALNETFVPLGGVRIESGQVDSLWFQADVERGGATGTVQGVYRNLEVETLDKATGDRGVGHRLKTVATGLALRSNNVPEDGSLDTGRIEHQRATEDSFFKFLWHVLRDGIYSLVGIDRLSR